MEIRLEKLFQCLRISPGYFLNDICRLRLMFPSSEVSPEVGKVVDSVSVDPLLDRVGPLLIGNRYIPQRPSHHLAEAVDDLMYRERFAYQGKHLL